MNFLLDTCAISECRKRHPSASFLKWFNGCDERMLYLSSITLGELRFGIDLLERGKQKNDLLTWYAQLNMSYQGHISFTERNDLRTLGCFTGGTKKIWPPVVDGGWTDCCNSS